MSFEQNIALRYLLSRKRLGFVSVISLISVVGVTIGVAALIVVLSVFNGFGGLVTSILVTFDPHLRIESPQRVEIGQYAQLVASLDSNPEIKGYSPYVSGKALVVSRNINRVVNIKGIVGERIASVSGLKDKMVLGDLNFSGQNGNGIVLGMTLADRLGVVEGDTIAVVSPSAAELATYHLGIPVIRRFHVIGMYESNNKDYDAYFAFTSLESAQSLFGVGKQIDGYEVRLGSPDRSEKVRNAITRQFGAAYRVLTWYDLHRELYSVMQIERWSAYIILCLIIAVASFNLLGSLTMTVIEKTRDIGILKAMGATNESIRKIFTTQGLFVGILGTMLGLVLGLLVVGLQERYHLFPLDPTVYIISAIPVEVSMLDLIVVALAAVGLSTFASRYPARRASNLVPVEAIRWE